MFLKRDCTESSIKKSYRKLSLKYHPDKNNGDSSKFQQIKEAYDILTNKEKRSYFDKNSLYGNSYEESNHSTHTKTDYSSKVNKDFQEKEKFFLKTDISDKIKINFKQIYNSNPIKYTYYRLMKCDECSGFGNDSNDGIECAMCDGTGKNNYGEGKCQLCGGKGSVSHSRCKFCSGKGTFEKKQTLSIDTKTLVPGERYNKEHSQGGNYNRSKNLYGKFLLLIETEQDPEFKIDENDILHKKIDVHFQDAIDGNTILYQHIDDKTYKINLKSRSKDKDVIKLKGLGMMIDKQRTDLYLHLNIFIDYNRV